jgi:N-acetylglucosaminyl-diphospho-decaprenol L-rhamnosyltransferase
VNRIAVIIVNYRTAGLVEDALASLDGQLIPGTDQAVVVDNASGDDSVGRIRAAVAQRGWESWVRVVEVKSNAGFSAGNNTGIRAVDADYYLLLNSDTIVRPGAIASMLEGMTAHPEAGLLGPRLEWPDGEPQISGFRFPTPLSELVQMASTGPVTKLFPRHEVAISVAEVPMPVDWASFACILIRRAALDTIGPMDEGYFMYYEDIDFCRRARQSGFGTIYWPHAHVVHLRGKSSPVKSLQQERKRRPAYYYAARARYYGKFYGRTGLWAANACWYLGHAIALVRQALQQRPARACEREYRDIWIHGLRPLRPYRMPVAIDS